jgi:hypothetical protein
MVFGPFPSTKRTAVDVVTRRLGCVIRLLAEFDPFNCQDSDFSMLKTLLLSECQREIQP